MTRSIGIKATVVAISSLALLLAACDNKPGPGPAETAGKKIDQSMEKMAKKLDQVSDRAKEQGSQAGQVLDDTAITAAVKAGILAEPGLKVLKIDVDTKEGRVILSGSADNADNVKRAEQIAGAVNGVKSVENRIAVSKSG